MPHRDSASTKAPAPFEGCFYRSITKIPSAGGAAAAFEYLLLRVTTKQSKFRITHIPLEHS
jgi:hypothetical protein